MGFPLKNFQKDALDALRKYLERVRLNNDPWQAFREVARTPSGLTPIYRPVEGLEDVPYVCLRLPTGGGKTILGAYAIRVAAQSYIENEFPVVLWLVPSNTIRIQTADALKNTAHPYRIALDEAFEGRVRVFDISEIENIRPADIAQNVCLVVATIQTLRVEKTDSRDVYAHKEALEDHFTRLQASVPGLETIAEGPNAGKIKYSFANLLRIHHPMVIVDEAHNVRTGLSFDALRRVSPSCIVELTATPDTSSRSGSNVLYRVSASQLKAEAMIKLPIVLVEEPTSWEKAVSDALRTRKRLAQYAEREPDYIRPILLIQAESKDRPANVEAVKQYLLETERVPAEQIAIATGDQRGLDKINLFERTCPIEIVITVQALKEGWDCSFAYVFCSTANIHSSKEVEQLLGRVLRMPYAKRRVAPELNKAYAHVSSPRFGQAAIALKDNLVEMGFEETEAKQFIEEVQAELPLFPSAAPPLTLTLEQAPDLSELTEHERQSVSVTEVAPGRVMVELQGAIPPAVEASILAATPAPARAEVQRKIAEHKATFERRLSPSQRGVVFTVPQLCVEFQGELALVDEELVLESVDWNLLNYPADLSRFEYNDASKTFELDIEGNRVVIHPKGAQQLDLNLLPTEQTDLDLVRWLDKQVRQPDVPQQTMTAWILEAVTGLLKRHNMSLPTLVRAKFILARKILELIDGARKDAKKRGWQELLFGTEARVQASEVFSFHYRPDDYPAGWLYSGGWNFQKHFYPVPGELESTGEEFQCAVVIDDHSAVKTRVRNLAKQPASSFWLQTSTDRFYPDFVAQLHDGRVLVVEYKGKAYATNDDSDEKRKLGALWAARSGGKALFLMAEKIKDGVDIAEQISAAVSQV
ncbi:MAG TPA: DEAD/DEAH box helicase family protein [Terracidiphilus sp.]|nr:DEAD/DEAH box helicase family protein [Terracidiphilus sp.]